MTRTRRTAAAAALLLALPLSVLAAGPALAAPGPGSSTTAPTALSAPATPAAPATGTVAPGFHAELPRPTGPYAVGREVLHLVDQDRPDPWVPSAGPRQLMVSMYYPAKPGTGDPAPYMTTEEARRMLALKVPGTTIPPEALAGTGTWARSGARPEHGRYPLVVLSPGFTMPRTELTSLAEDLASRGYVVASVDHTYENSGTTFPDGHTTPCVLCGHLHPGDAAKVSESRAKDVSFVIDQLTAHPHPAWRYARMIDGERIGMAGHSLGGAAAVPAMQTDDRILAGVNLDGTMEHTVPAEGLDGRPFLLISHAQEGPGEDPTWTESWAHLDGWKRWLTVAGSNHGTFTDLPVLAAAAGLPEPPGTTITPQRSVALTRSYVAAFFDLHLKGVAQPVLDGPTPADPEVTFHP
ncbi:alpha/beta hydrolase [Kitasatospora sp. NPDC097643]|uniref:alpha/beta hydrolase family protein n=1 Tax=Kitasatospora sp. NPDC097643 TaxID=3157230 RepID=UPI00332769F9